MKRWACAVAVVAAALVVGPTESLAKTEISFWHAMGGQLGDTVNELVKQFNHSQAEYEVKARGWVKEFRLEQVRSAYHQSRYGGGPR